MHGTIARPLTSGGVTRRVRSFGQPHCAIVQASAVTTPISNTSSYRDTTSWFPVHPDIQLEQALEDTINI